MSVRTRAVELRVEGVERVSKIGDRQARSGYEFVIVDTSWKNIIPLRAVDKSSAQSGVGGLGLGGTRRPVADPANTKLEPTPYVVPMLQRLLWLLSDDRYADSVDLDAQVLAPNHFSKDGFGMPKLDDVARGTLVFEAPAGARYQALQFYDNDNGHALVPLTGTRPTTAAPALTPPRQNDALQVVLTEARFLSSDTNTPEGQRPYLLGVRGVSRSPRDIIEVPMVSLYAQTDQGCLASPERHPEGLTRPFVDKASFVPTGANEGQLVFLVPTETRSVRLLVRAQRGQSIDVPSVADFHVSLPTPVATITDGHAMRIQVLPTPALPKSVPTPTDSRGLVPLDVAGENLNNVSGVELQWVQLRLQAANGSFINPSPLSAEVPCHLPDGGVIPPGATRRFTLIYDVPAGEPPHKLQYRGFELQETTVDLP
jgi:hypothetical protein